MNELTHSTHGNALPLSEVERIVEYVCDHLAIGRPLSKILMDEDEELVSYGCFMRWQQKYDWIDEKVARARDAGSTYLVDEMVDIADTERDPKRARIRIYAREKAAQMLSPKKYGNKVDITSGGEKLPEGATTVLADNRMQSLILLAQQRKSEGKSMYDIKKQLMEE